MKKYILDLTVTENVRLHAHYVLLKLTSPQMELPEMLPGQFAEIRVDGAAPFPSIMWTDNATRCGS